MHITEAHCCDPRKKQGSASRYNVKLHCYIVKLYSYYVNF